MVLKVEGNGYAVEIRYFFYMTDDLSVQYNPNPVCKGLDHWNISTTTAPTPDTLQSLLTSLGLSNLVQVNTTDLTGAAVGSTTGSSITLDTDAAGYGWHIDYTPYLNEEYLPTSNPYEWIAKPGSDSEGKMDLLSVLLHNTMMLDLTPLLLGFR